MTPRRRKGKRPSGNPSGAHERDPERDTWVVAMRQAGATLDAIAEAHASIRGQRISRERVRQILEREAAPNWSAHSPDVRRAMVALRDRRARSLTSLAALAETSSPTMATLLQELGLAAAAQRLFRLRIRRWPHRRPGGRREPKYTEEQMLTALRALAERLGKTPSMQDIIRAKRAHPEIPYGLTYAYRFGSLREAQRRAGLTPNEDNAADYHARLAAERTTHTARRHARTHDNR